MVVIHDEKIDRTSNGQGAVLDYTYEELLAFDFGCKFYGERRGVKLPLLSDVYELLDLGFGKCRMCVAAPCSYREDAERPLRVATKFPNIAKNYYLSRNREIEIIKLYGSIEIAPLTGLSDVIVDIVETGTTLKENNLEVTETILPISARLIANKAGSNFKAQEIKKIVDALRLRKVN